MKIPVKTGIHRGKNIFNSSHLNVCGKNEQMFDQSTRAFIIFEKLSTEITTENDTISFKIANVDVKI